MARDLLRTFARLFSTAKSRIAVGALILVLAALPVAEILALRYFSVLVIEGPARYDSEPHAVAFAVVAFLLAFAVIRSVQHVMRYGRVRLFRRAFGESPSESNPSQESWEWALAFELSNVLASVVQSTALIAMFLILDPPTGIVNLVLSGVAIAVIALLYRRQLFMQREYVRTGTRPGSAPIASRVGVRIRSAELGSALASAAMLLALLVALWRVIVGELDSADAIAMLLGLRLLAGQLTAWSSGVMRFARASARRDLT